MVHKPVGYTRVKGSCGAPPEGLQLGSDSLGTERHSLSLGSNVDNKGILPKGLQLASIHSEGQMALTNSVGIDSMPHAGSLASLHPWKKTGYHHD